MPASPAAFDGVTAPASRSVLARACGTSRAAPRAAAASAGSQRARVTGPWVSTRWPSGELEHQAPRPPPFERRELDAPRPVSPPTAPPLTSARSPRSVARSFDHRTRARIARACARGTRTRASRTAAGARDRARTSAPRLALDPWTLSKGNPGPSAVRVGCQRFFCERFQRRPARRTRAREASGHSGAAGRGTLHASGPHTDADPTDRRRLAAGA